MKPKTNTGFTLIELLVVIAIIGVLAGIILLALNDARAKGRDAKRAGDMRQMITALEQYHIANGTYPTGTASMAIIGTGSVLDDAGTFDGAAEPFVPNYIPMIPAAPKPADGPCTDGIGRGNNNYWYDVSDNGTTYTMTFCLGGQTGQWPAGLRVATPDGVQ